MLVVDRRAVETVVQAALIHRFCEEIWNQGHLKRRDAFLSLLHEGVAEQRFHDVPG
jgi:hypothetical protein